MCVRGGSTWSMSMALEPVAAKEILRCRSLPAPIDDQSRTSITTRPIIIRSRSLEVRMYEASVKSELNQITGDLVRIRIRK